MKLHPLCVAVGLSVIACDQTSTGPEASGRAPGIDQAVITNDRIQFVEDNFVPCANGGAGEVVRVTVKLHIVVRQTLDAAGGVHLASHFQDAGSNGVGLVTGDVYRRVGQTKESFKVSASGFPVVLDFVNIFDFIAPGPGNNFQVHDVIHMTITRNGVTSDVLKSTARCK